MARWCCLSIFLFHEDEIISEFNRSYFVQFLLVKFASMIDVPVLKCWSPNVTHVIASTDADGACTRTFKVLMAISTGKWVLKMDCKLTLGLSFSSLTFISSHHWKLAIRPV